jgi:hypothetical protein
MELRNPPKTGTMLMAIHKQILEWQAAHPTITWIGWGIVWAIVLFPVVLALQGIELTGSAATALRGDPPSEHHPENDWQRLPNRDRVARWTGDRRCRPAIST